MSIQFHHRRIVKQTIYSNEIAQTITTEIKAKGGTTIALQVPTVEQFDEFKITDTTKRDWELALGTIELSIGITKCSKDDNYNKKIGRQIAKGRMQTLVFWIKKNSENEIVLVACQSQFKIPELILRKSPLGGRVYLIGTK